MFLKVNGSEFSKLSGHDPPPVLAWQRGNVWTVPALIRSKTNRTCILHQFISGLKMSTARNGSILIKKHILFWIISPFFIQKNCIQLYSISFLWQKCSCRFSDVLVYRKTVWNFSHLFWFKDCVWSSSIKCAIKYHFHIKTKFKTYKQKKNL